jgi:hypothetical protein
MSTEAVRAGVVVALFEKIWKKGKRGNLGKCG